MKRAMEAEGLDFYSYTWINGASGTTVRLDLPLPNRRVHLLRTHWLTAVRMAVQAVTRGAERAEDTEALELSEGLLGVEFHRAPIAESAFQVGDKSDSADNHMLRPPAKQQETLLFCTTRLHDPCSCSSVPPKANSADWGNTAGGVRFHEASGRTFRQHDIRSESCWRM